MKTLNFSGCWLSAVVSLYSSLCTKVLLGSLLCRPFLKNPNKFIRKEDNAKAVVSWRPIDNLFFFLLLLLPAFEGLAGCGWTLARRHLLLNNICSCYSLSPSMPRDTQVLPRVAFCVPHCQFHHCLLKSVPIRPWVYKPLQRTNSTGLMIYSYLCPNTICIFVGQLRKRTLRNWFYTVWLLCSDVTELCCLFFFNSFFSGNRKSRFENQT